MRPGRCARRTPGRPSPSPAGWRPGATTAASRSSTCATRPARRRWCSATPTPRTTCATSGCVAVTGEVRARPEGNVNAALPTGEIEIDATSIEVLNESRRCRSRSTSTSEVGEEARLRYRYLDLRRFGPGGGAAAAQRGEPRRPRRAVRARLRRDRDADADPVDARGRARLPGPGAAAARAAGTPCRSRPQLFKQLLMVAWHGALLPDRALLPRRGLPRRPAAGVHPARHRDELRRAGRRDRARRGTCSSRSGG